VDDHVKLEEANKTLGQQKQAAQSQASGWCMAFWVSIGLWVFTQYFQSPSIHASRVTDHSPQIDTHLITEIPAQPSTVYEKRNNGQVNMPKLPKSAITVNGVVFESPATKVTVRPPNTYEQQYYSLH
jgi:hypothetical protein